MQKTILHWLLFFVFVQNAAGQEMQILGIGDAIPDVGFGKVANAGNLKSFRDLKGKLVILDFWNTRCKACLHAMPKLDSLQKLFGDSIKIILISKEKKEEVDRLFSRLHFSFPQLLSITEDKIFSQLFPHEGEPFQVWISKEGKIKYLMSDNNTTAQNISIALNGGNIPVINLEPETKFDFRQPLIQQAGTKISTLIDYYSLLMRGLQRYERNTVVHLEKDSAKKKVEKVTTINLPILSLFYLAFNPSVYGYETGTLHLEQNNRVINELSHPEIFFRPNDPTAIDAWKNNNLVSYEVKIPEDAGYSVYEIMQKDVNRLFDIEGVIEKRKIKCLVLIDSGMRKTTLENRVQNYGYTKGGDYVLQNAPLGKLVEELALRYEKQGLPVVMDNTDNSNVDIVLNCDLGDLNTLKKELGKYGLGLIEKEMLIDMLILKDKR